MKIGIMKIGGNITFSSGNKSAANADILYAIRVLNPRIHKFTVITKKTRNTSIPPIINFEDILQLNSLDSLDLDVIMLFNGSINFFGGAKDPVILKLYSLLSKSSTPVAFINTDGNLGLRKLWPMIECRDWAQDLNPSDYSLDPDMITCLTQGHDLNRTSQHLNTDKHSQPMSRIAHYNWASCILANHGKLMAKQMRFRDRPFKDRAYDLSFGGAVRNTYKRKKVEKFYRGIGPTHIFGTMAGKAQLDPSGQFTKTPKVSFQEVIPTMSNARGTIIVGDGIYEDNFLTLRMYEGLLAGCLVYIDRDMDPQMRFYDQEFAQLHVTSPLDVEDSFGHAPPSVLQELAQSAYESVTRRYILSEEQEKVEALLMGAAK